MDHKRAIREVISHRNVRPVPYTIRFTVEAHENIRRYLGKDFDPVTYTGSYVVASHTNHGWEEVRPGYFRDYFGVVWNKTLDRTLGVVEDPPLKDFDFSEFRFPDPDRIPVYRFVKENNLKYPGRFHQLSIGFFLFERAWSLVGMENLMMRMMSDPGAVGELLDRIADYNIGIIKNAAGMGVDSMHFGDDWGTQKGLMIGADLWREFIKPRYQRICRAATSRGLIVSQHSCGQIEELIPDMIECGVSIFNPFQPEVMDIWKVREKYRGKITFWGGLSIQKTLPMGSPGDVRNETIRLIRDMAPGGGYILAPSHAITGDVPVENIMEFLRVVRTQENHIKSQIP